MRAAGQDSGPGKRLARAVARLSARLDALDAQLDAGEAVAWQEYAAVAASLATVMAQAAPGARGEFLSTKAMAQRLDITPKTLLRHKAAGAVRPALQRGKWIRWRGDEAAR
jgi:hypothetical protein